MLTVRIARLLVVAGVMAALPPAAGATEKALLHAREGVAALLRGKYEQAIAAYDEALRLGDLADARRANIYNDRGVAKWRLQRPRDAIADFNHAVELLPAFPVVYNNRGNVLLELGRAEEALKDFDRAIALAPAYGVAHNNRGNALFQLGRYDEALRAYTRAIELMTTNPVPFNGRGKTHNAMGRPYAALRDFSRAVALNAKYDSAYGNRGRAYAELERYSNAISDFAQALSAQPERADLYLARARAYAADDKLGPAIKDLSRAIDGMRASAEAFAERGALYAKAQQFKEAWADLSKAIELRPDHARAYAERAAVSLKTGAPEEAMADVSQALRLDPDDPVALKVRGDIHDSQGRSEEAAADYRAALERDPTLADARAALRRIAGEAPPIEVEIVESVVKGWTIARSTDGRYVATNPDHPRVRVRLEMYGPGTPRILDWELMRNAFRGIGLLRYEAGVARDRDGAPLEYVAIVDLWQNAVVAIEPRKLGDVEAKWEWREASLVVTDPSGVANELQLRRPRPPQPQVATDQGRHWFFDQEWGRQARPRTYRAPSRGGGGFLDWLFGN